MDWKQLMESQPAWDEVCPDRLRADKRPAEAYLYSPPEFPRSMWAIPFAFVSDGGAVVPHIRRMKAIIGAAYADEKWRFEDLHNYPGAIDRLKAAMASIGMEEDIAALAARLAKIASDLPEDQQPIPGWWEDLYVDGDSLYGRQAGMSKRFADLNRARFPRRSMELRRKAGEPWDLLGGVILGVKEPAIPLKDIDPADTKETIDGVELLRAGKWPAETGDFEVTRQDLDETLALWKSKGSPRIPIVGIGGHEREPEVRLSAADGSQTLRFAIPQQQEVDMSEQLKKDQAPAENAALAARTAELEAKLAAETKSREEAEKARKDQEAKLAAQDAKLAALQRKSDEGEVDAYLSRLTSGPVGLAKPSIDTLKPLLMAAKDPGYAALAAGETQYGRLQAFVDSVLSQGLVKAAPVIPGGALDQGNPPDAKTPQDAKLAAAKSDFERLGGEAVLGVTLDQWTKAAA